MYNPFTLENKTILVIGASSGIGQAIAIECSKMGAKVLISARNEENLKETLSMMSGEGHQIIVGDITKEEDCTRIIDTIPAIEGLVLSAGKGCTKPFSFGDKDKFHELFELNFFATVEMVRLLYKKKKIVKCGSIVLISSIGGVKTFNIGNSIYGASKAALNSIMHFAAHEFAARKIRVNSICPGMVHTNMILRSSLSEEDFEKNKELYPLKRYGEPKDVAYGAVYLLSDASSWVTGHSLVMDGGVTSR